MKRLFLFLLLGVLFGLSAAEPAVPRLTGRVVDRANIFGTDGAARIDAAIRALETATGGGQMAVLTIDTLDGTPIEEYGIRVMDQWKIGRKDKDDGAILIIALRDHEMRLEIGYGWEGDINDARAGDIIRGLAPFFRENRYTDGVLFAVGEVQRFVTGKAPENQPKAPARASREIRFVPAGRRFHHSDSSHCIPLRARRPHRRLRRGLRWWFRRRLRRRLRRGRRILRRRRSRGRRRRLRALVTG